MKKRTEKCPLCGGKLAKKTGDVSFPVQRRKLTVKNISYLECVNCKEKIFSQDAQSAIETAAYGRSKKSVA